MRLAANRVFVVLVWFLSRAQGNVDTRILQGCAWTCHRLSVLTKLAGNKVHILLSFATDCVFFFANVQWITVTKLPDPELPWALMSFLSFKDFAVFCYPSKSAAGSQAVRTTWHKPTITSAEAGRTLAGTFNDKMPSSQSSIHPVWKKNERMRYGISLFHKMLGLTSFHILVCVLSLIMCIYLQRRLKQVYIGFRLKILYWEDKQTEHVPEPYRWLHVHPMQHCAPVCNTHSFISRNSWVNSFLISPKVQHNESISARSSDIILRFFWGVFLSISKSNMKQISATVSVGVIWFYAALYCSQTNSLVLQSRKLIKRSACFLLSLDRNCKYYYVIYSNFLNCMFVEPFQGECGCFGIDSWWFESPKRNNPENKSWLPFFPSFSLLHVWSAALFKRKA